MKKIRIMHVVQSNGGVERYLKNLLKYINKDKFENILVCTKFYKIENFLEYTMAVECVDLQREIELKHDLLAIVAVRKLIIKYRPDILYFHSSKAGAIGRMAKIGLGIKCIYNPHGWAFNMSVSPAKKYLYQMIECILAKFTNQIICISEAERNSALKHNICGNSKLVVIDNGIDIDESIKSRNSSVNIPNMPRDAFVIGMVGRLSQQKAPDIFIRVAKKIKEKIPTAYFLMVGDGEERDNIDNYIHQNAMDEYVTITGWVSNPLDYIRKFNVGMLLSRWEGFGLVLAEYMCCGVPIVANRIDAIPYVVKDRYSGILIDKDDVNAAEEAVIRLYQSSDLRTFLINNGYKEVTQRFNAKKMAQETEKTILKIVGQYDLGD